MAGGTPLHSLFEPLTDLVGHQLFGMFHLVHDVGTNEGDLVVVDDEDAIGECVKSRREWIVHGIHDDTHTAGVGNVFTQTSVVSFVQRHKIPEFQKNDKI